MGEPGPPGAAELLLCGSDFPLVSISSNHKALILRYIHSGTRARLCGN